MRIYPKKLHSITDLEREKKKMIKLKQELDKDEFLDVPFLKKDKDKKKGDSEKEDSSGGFDIASLLSLLPVGNPIADLVLNIVKKRFAAAPATKKSKARGNDQAEETPHKSFLRKAIVEVAGGYLKWKAIELSYKGVKHIIKKRKEAKMGAE